MKRFLWLCVGLLLSANTWAATYRYTGPVYFTLDFTPPCAPTATCQNYPVGGRITGQFTTATPLAANLNDVSIVAQLASYSFSDGIHVFSSGDTRTRLIIFRVSTGAAGEVTNAHISMQRWATPTAPHQIGDWFGDLFISSGGTELARHNSLCDSVGLDDYCSSSLTNPGSRSQAWASTRGSWQTVAEPTSVPTLSAWALLALAGLIGLAGLWGRQRHV